MNSESATAIRIANQGDAELLAELGASTFREAYAAPFGRPEILESYIQTSFNISRTAEDLADPHSTYFIAEHDSDAVAYAKLYAGKPLDCVLGPQPVELKRLYVRASHIGCGIGAGLMRRCIETAKEAGHKTIWLGVWRYNSRAQEFYRRWGFKVTGSRVIRLESYEETDPVMELLL